MGLLLPKLDDKSFATIAEEGRSLIPSAAPEWTDHNVHDPGITFLELFAWLAEIEQYRLDRTSASSYARFFSLMGIVPFGPQPAEVTVAFEFESLAKGVFVKSGTTMTAIGNESLPFATTRDLYLTTAKLIRVITITGDRETVLTTAEENEVGYYEAFGRSPKVGDSLQLEFKNWFSEPQGHLAITLFEDDLLPRAPFAVDARGFESSAKVQWEYRVAAGGDSSQQWAPLEVVVDGTLNLSRSGELIFRGPPEPPASVPKQLRAVLTDGHFEIPPRIIRIQTNTITARQVETIVNEDLKAGLGTADQIVRLKKYPLLMNEAIDEGPFQAGDVLDWKALIARLRRPDELYESRLAETVKYIAATVREEVGPLLDDPNLLRDEEKRGDQEYFLAQAFDKLLSGLDPRLSRRDFYQREKFPTVRLPDEFSRDTRDRRCKRRGYVRRLNRFLLQSIFPDLFVTDRIEIQTGFNALTVEEEPKTWRNWQRVEHFLESGPGDLHYVLNPHDGIIRFGNGLNGKAPSSSEMIRARFYRYSQLEKGNLPANHLWELGVTFPFGKRFATRKNPPLSDREKRENLKPATGGRDKELLEETKLRSREVFRKEKASLTAGDYETLALNTPGLRVARAKVLPNFNPVLPRWLKLPGEITVLVLPAPPPKDAFPDAPPPEPSEGFLKTIQSHLESRRLVTTSIHVRGPKYVEVSVRCRVFLKKRASEIQVGQNLDRALREFLDPVSGGPEQGEGWPFGRSVFPSEVSQQLAKVPGVDYVTGVSLNGLKVGEPLKLDYNGLPKPPAGALPIELVPFESRSKDPTTGGEGPKYVDVSVRCRVFLQKRASESQARANINRALNEFLDPVSGGPEKGKGWPPGRSVFPSEVRRQLAKVPGVHSVTGVSLNGLKVGEPLALPYDGLPGPSLNTRAIELVRFENRGEDAATSKGGDRCE